MYKIGEYVVYGTSGVCEITDVCASPFDKRDTRTFYVLRPVSGASTSLIYTPVDNDRVPMRCLLSLPEAQALMERIAGIPCLTVQEERARREIYRAAIAEAHPEAYVAVIKTIHARRRSFQGTQRRLPDFELEYESTARRHLFAELAVVLGKQTNEVEEYIAERVV